MSRTTPTIDEVCIGMDATSHSSAGTRSSTRPWASSPNSWKVSSITGGLTAALFGSLRVILYSFSVEYYVPSPTGAVKE